MIIITNIILYFIQMRHADDFPSMGTRLVVITPIAGILFPVCLQGKFHC